MKRVIFCIVGFVSAGFSVAENLKTVDVVAQKQTTIKENLSINEKGVLLDKIDTQIDQLNFHLVSMKKARDKLVFDERKEKIDQIKELMIKYKIKASDLVDVRN